MTDAPARTPRAIPCPDCSALVLDTIEDRRRHRGDHAQERKVLEAVRERLKEADAAIRELRLNLEHVRQDIGNIHIPDPVDPLDIGTASDWEDDDDEPYTPAYDDETDDQPLDATTGPYSATDGTSSVRGVL